MFHFFSQKRLQSRGFSSGQKRRKPNETAASEMMRTGWQICGLLFILFAVLVSSWIVFTSSDTSIFAGNPLQAFVVVTVICATFMVHWHVSLPQTFRQNSTVTLMLTIILTQLMLVKLSEYVATTFAPG
ncbi:MAG: hypothetical protein P1U81_04580, partial [Verrucomicrobiales bacterium]|nr:hypothetical protein [Verrucomicrobiales bacterium]